MAGAKIERWQSVKRFTQLLITPVLLLVLAAQSGAKDTTPETVCGAEYHVFSPEPVRFHARETITLKELLDADIVAEGVVLSKRTYGPDGVQNDIEFRIEKLLRCCFLQSPERPPVPYRILVSGDVIAIHVDGGYAPGRDQTCLRDMLDEGAGVEVGGSYLVTGLTKEADTEYYRSNLEASWFRITAEGKIISTTIALINNKALAGQTISDLEKLAEAR